MSDNNRNLDDEWNSLFNIKSSINNSTSNELTQDNVITDNIITENLFVNNNAVIENNAQINNVMEVADGVAIGSDLNTNNINAFGQVSVYNNIFSTGNIYLNNDNDNNYLLLKNNGQIEIKKYNNIN
jgi:UDP-3-O-[3-hydroxymyristoyl] glucosamine N-acyltransferase